MPLFRLIAAGGTLLLTACGTWAATGGHRHAASATVVSMERTTCFGMCPAYSVTLAADGHVTFDGIAHVQTMGPAAAQASPAQLEAVRAAIAQADLRSLGDHYTTHADGCSPLMMDMNGVKITISDAHGSKTVDFYYGCRGAIANQVRPRIDTLASSIDRQLDTARWIGKPSGPGVPGEAVH
ncbi:MAG: hypothetical protein KGJ97_05580 [Xanthomonadaceae bacterium]|jgi:hypothetical protein|nr:hypothetical protein [Xanthomonadaceae bacterium]MDE3072556.1 hypothetical protein [Pseudomonadota bacterium]